MLNKKISDYWFLFAGIAGSLILLFGLLQPYSQPYYIAGSCLLLGTAIHFQLIYFIALELILIAGHSAIYLGIGSTLQVALPSLLCLQLLFYYIVSGQFNNLYLLTGILGIGALSIGFSYNNEWIFMFGSLSIATYAFHNSKTFRVSLIWAILNTLFTLIMMIKIAMPYINQLTQTGFRGLHG